MDPAGRSEENLRQQVRPPESQTHQPPPPQKCPRCDSSNTKFCYYNNYSHSQPRYFCKACRRYWTHGGTLRNVPVGGGCRKSKSKRPKTLPPPLSGNEIARTQRLSAALPSQDMISGPAFRALPPVIPPAGNPFYAGGSLLSSMRSLHGGISQGAAVNLGDNMAILQGASLPSVQPHAPQTGVFPVQQSLIPPGPLTSWTQRLTVTGGSSSSAAAGSSYWSSATGCNTADGGDQAGSSFGQNQ